MRRRRLHKEDGNALVETALAAAIMLGVIFALFEMFLAFYTYHYIAYAAREASRYAIVRGSDCATDSATMTDCNAEPGDIQTFVQNLDFPGMDPSKITVSTTWLTPTWNPANSSTSWTACTGVTTTSNGGCNAPGNQVQVTVNYAFPLNLAFFHSTTLHMSSTSALVISQ